MKRSKELEKLLFALVEDWCNNCNFGVVICVNEDERRMKKAITAIEKWAKERYGRAKRFRA